MLITVFNTPYIESYLNTQYKVSIDFFFFFLLNHIQNITSIQGISRSNKISCTDDLATNFLIYTIISLIIAYVPLYYMEISENAIRFTRFKTHSKT